MKISEVIDQIIARHPAVPADTVDVVKYGDPGKECTGVAVTCYASVPVIRRCAQLGWEAYLYKHPNKPLIYHIPETTGRALADWLPEIVGPDTPVHFLPSGDSFQYILK